MALVLSLAFHSARVQGRAWMSSNQLAASIGVLPSHTPSKANAPPIHSSADRIAPQPHLAILSQLSSSPGPTRKLPWMFVEKVYSTLCLPSIDGTAKVQMFDSLDSRFTFIFDPGCLRLGGDPLSPTLGRSACNVFQHSCRPAAEAKPTSDSATCNAPNSLTCLQIKSTAASSSSRGCGRAWSAVRTTA